MNWKEVQIKYPKSWGLLELHKGSSVTTKLTFQNHKMLRDLYDLFDENDFFISISVYMVNDWFYEIHQPCDDDSISFKAEADKHMNRSEAETAAFTKAFELLEVNLNKK